GSEPGGRRPRRQGCRRARAFGVPRPQKRFRGPEKGQGTGRGPRSRNRKTPRKSVSPQNEGRGPPQSRTVPRGHLLPPAAQSSGGDSDADDRSHVANERQSRSRSPGIPDRARTRGGSRNRNR